MRVLMYCLSSVSGGLVSYIRNIAPLLDVLFRESRGEHSLKFLAHKDQSALLEGIDESRIVWVEGERPMGYRRVLWEHLNIDRIVRRVGVDVFFNPHQVGCWVRGPKHVLMLRNMEPFLRGDYPSGLELRLRNYLLVRESVRSLRRADRVIAISHFVRDHLVSEVGVESGRIRMIYHGRSEKLTPDGDVNEDRDLLQRHGVGDRYVLTCGSLFPYRRCEDVVEAFSRCAGDLHPAMQLVIAGTGPDRQYGNLIREAIESSPYRRRILALGHVPWETMVVLYRRCLACVIATEIEACPNIAIEAMAMGCVIVSSDRPPLPEIFRGASLEYRARDIDHLVEQLRACIDREELRGQMRARALERATDFSWKKCAMETYGVLTDWQ